MKGHLSPWLRLMRGPVTSEASLPSLLPGPDTQLDLPGHTVTGEGEGGDGLAAEQPGVNGYLLR